MGNSVYDKGGPYFATILKANGIAKQITSIIKIRTPDVYEDFKEINVIALWDTGATGSCISKKFAD